MIQEGQILLYLCNDNWFRPSKSLTKKKIHDSNGNIIEVAQSYYHNFADGSQILIRVSEHGTSLQTWVKRRFSPTMSLQNLSVVFSDKPITSNVETETVEDYDATGNIIKKYVYFVVEQYAYNTQTLSMNDLKKIITKIKHLGKNTVFRDPLRKKVSKFATRKVLTPKDMHGNKISPSTNQVNLRQTIVANNPENEIDANGNIIKDSKQYRRRKNIITLSEEYLRNLIRRYINEGKAS